MCKIISVYWVSIFLIVGFSFWASKFGIQKLFPTFMSFGLVNGFYFITSSVLSFTLSSLIVLELAVMWCDRSGFHFILKSSFPCLPDPRNTDWACLITEECLARGKGACLSESRTVAGHWIQDWLRGQAALVHLGFDVHPCWATALHLCQPLPTPPSDCDISN